MKKLNQLISETIFDKEASVEALKIQPDWFLDHMAKFSRLGIGCIWNSLSGRESEIKYDIESLADDWDRYGFKSRGHFENYFQVTLEYVLELVQAEVLLVGLLDFEDLPEWWPSTREWVKIKDIHKNVTEVLIIGAEPLRGIIGISTKAKPNEIAFIKKLLAVFRPQ